jgi:lysozyme family protein
MTRDDIIAFVIGLEGGYVDNPADPGGSTKYGITQRYLNMAHGANPGLDLPGSVIELNMTQAADLYANDQWIAIHGDGLPWGLALLAFDMAVNQGPRKAIVTLQQALKVTPDGLMGPATLTAAKGAGVVTCAEFAARRMACYAQLDATEGEFELGWARRLITVYTKAVS